MITNRRSEAEKNERWLEELESVAIRKNLPNLLNTFLSVRQAGTSTALANLAQREPISVIVGDHQEGMSLVNLVRNGRIHPKSRIATMAQLISLRGLRQPLFVDNGLMMRLLEDAIFCMRAIPELLLTIRKMRRVLKENDLWSPDLERGAKDSETRNA